MGSSVPLQRSGVMIEKRQLTMVVSGCYAIIVAACYYDRKSR
jgi:hypothetical protein